MITQPLSTGSAAAFASQRTLSKLVPGDYTVRSQQGSLRSRRDVSSDDGTATCTALQQLLTEETTAHAEEMAALQTAHAEEKVILHTAHEEERAAHAAEKVALTQLIAASKDYTPWFIAIAVIQVGWRPRGCVTGTKNVFIGIFEDPATVQLSSCIGVF